MQKLYAIASAQNGAAKTNTYKVMVNGSATGAPTCTMTNATTCNDTSTTLAVSAGAEVAMQITAATGTTAVKHSWGFECD